MSNFRVDSNAPEVLVTSSPGSLQAGRTAKFAFESTEPGITFKCALMSGESIARLADWGVCTSPKVWEIYSSSMICRCDIRTNRA